MRLSCAKTPRREARMRWAGLLTLAGLLALPAWAQRPSAPAVPVVLITVDTLRADRVGAYGCVQAETPAMDELARQGVTFENAIVQTPITLPSHASIMTGTYPFYHGLQDVVGRLDEKIPTLGEWFQGRGYATGAFVGASVLSANWGLDRGFDHYDDDFSRSGSTGSRIDFDRVERNAEAVVSRAIPWMEKQRN
ncbi:MAG: sulfatase-like hydrolase/transferase, partial [Acidobacteriota bacterium]